MTETTTITETPNEQPPDGPIPATPIPVAEIIAPLPGEKTLTLELRLDEVGAIAACVQTSLKSGWVRELSHVNTCNSVLRKIHEAKLKFIRDNPDA